MHMLLEEGGKTTPLDTVIIEVSTVDTFYRLMLGHNAYVVGEGKD